MVAILGVILSIWYRPEYAKEIATALGVLYVAIQAFGKDKK